MPEFDHARFNVQYAKRVRVLRELFDEHYLSAFEEFATIASAELSADEQVFFSRSADPKPTDGRDPSYRYLFGFGEEIREDVYTFGTHLDLVRADGVWNFGVMRRHVTATLRPFHEDLIISAFVFEDRGGMGDADRHAQWSPSVPLPMHSEWNVENFLAHIWDRAVQTRSEDLFSESHGWWDDPVRLVPHDFVQELP